MFLGRGRSFTLMVETVFRNDRSYQILAVYMKYVQYGTLYVPKVYLKYNGSWQYDIPKVHLMHYFDGAFDIPK